MTRDRQRVGRDGEARAEAELLRAGMRTVARRFRTRHGEIDLIAVAGETVVFVEVKTRRGRGFGAAEAVTPAKRRRMALVASAFLARRRWHDRACRFDVVEVLDDDDVRHLADAFRLWPTG